MRPLRRLWRARAPARRRRHCGTAAGGRAGARLPRPAPSPPRANGRRGRSEPAGADWAVRTRALGISGLREGGGERRAARPGPASPAVLMQSG